MKKIKVNVLKELVFRLNHKDRSQAEEFVKEHFPYGSGFDSGTSLVRGNAKRIILYTAFHHMDDNGSYIGWTHHNVYIDAHLGYTFTVKATGKDKNGIKDYIEDRFHETLNSEVEIELKI